MKIRLATPQDFSPIGRVATAAFVDDPMDIFFFPGRREHPLKYHELYVRSARETSKDADCRVFVAVTEPGDAFWSGKIGEEVVGFVFWRRERDGKERGLREKIQRKIVSWKDELYLVDLVRDLFNGAVSVPNVLRGYRYCRPKYDTYLDKSYKEPDAYWGLDELAVAPDFQRNGIAGRLIEWGLDRAREDKVPVVVFATPVGRKAYEKAGFEVIGSWRWRSGEDADASLTIMRWDPPDG